MFTYVGLIQLTDEGRENIEKAPEYLAKFTEIIEAEGGKLDRVLAVMGPWDFITLVRYPDVETAFRVLAKIGALEVIKTETFPAEDVEVFFKALA
ncbi:MAG: GYD domain-containing protein [Pseudomonadota bacterium]